MFGYFKRMMRLSRWERRARADGTAWPEAERSAMAAAIALERAQLYWPFTATCNLIFFFGVASAIWGMAIRQSLLWSALIGVGLGLAIALTICRAPIFATLDDLQQLKDRQIFIGVWVKLAMVIGAVGLLVWGVRSFF